MITFRSHNRTPKIIIILEHALSPLLSRVRHKLEKSCSGVNNPYVPPLSVVAVLSVVGPSLFTRPTELMRDIRRIGGSS